jgi:phage terminase large subunit GpA-like protein
MVDGIDILHHQLSGVAKASRVRICTDLPSQWAEKTITIKSGGRPGPLRYDNSPYAREIINCLAEDHPARVISMQKGQQIGASSTILLPGMAYLIKNRPNNMVFSVGAPDLIKAASRKVDHAFADAGIQFSSPLVKLKNNATGDTTKLKEGIGWWLRLMTLDNHNNIADFSAMYGFLDDLDRNATETTDFGDTGDIIMGRFSAYDGIYKIMKVSTPKFKASSQIEPAYLLSDQRKYFTPCPRCNDGIEILWEHPEGGGIYWEPDNHGGFKAGSVGYVCPKCAKFFNDSKKMDWLNAGIWIPQTTAKIEGHYGYKISSLYAPTFMFGWKKYVSDWLQIHPQNQPRNEAKYQTFQNVVLGETYDAPTQSPDSKSIQKNLRPYQPWMLPEKLSISDGNGKIVCLTMAVDMGGKMSTDKDSAGVDDVRLDWEVVAWTETGASYSVAHGSIGTFLRGEIEDSRKDRIKWTYDFSKPNCVWPELDKIHNRVYYTDTGRSMQIVKSGLDCGHWSHLYAYPYVDKTPRMVAIRGKGVDGFTNEDADNPFIKPSLEKKGMYILFVNPIKDALMGFMNLSWNSQNDEKQPYGFMNFPKPSDGMYDYPGFFEDFESEQRVGSALKNGGFAFVWKKKRSNVRNHFWDTRVYNIAMQHIILYEFAKGLKLPKLTWREYADMCVKILDQLDRNSKLAGK